MDRPDAGRWVVALGALALAIACQSAQPGPAAAPEPRVTAPAESCAVLRERAAAQGYRAADVRPREMAFALPEVYPDGPHGESVSDFVLGFTVDTAGRVDTASVRASANVRPDYVRVVRRTAARWRYRAAFWGGCRVPFTVVDTVQLRIAP